MRTVLLCVLLLWLYGCRKLDNPPAQAPEVIKDSAGFTKYLIPSGAHYTVYNPYTPVEVDTLAFEVRFDSSAIYETRLAGNQFDINKLYGFSDNGAEHHQYSARFGWRWSDGALRLFAYVYNAGNMVSEEISAVRIDAVIRCRIAVAGDEYIFYCNERTLRLPRKSATALGKGYLLYPYFGGDETAPHDVAIWIRLLSF